MAGGDVATSYETARGISGKYSTRAFNTTTGNIATSTDEYTKVSSFAYDSIDRIVSIWDAKGSVTNFYTDGVWEGRSKRRARTEH